MRSLARECAFKVIFASLFHDDGMESLERGIFRSAELDREDAAFAKLLCDAVFAHREELDGLLNRYSIGFSADRLFATDKSILLMSFAELRFVGGTPGPVVADEAVKLSRKYSAEKSAGFVNGVMASFIADCAKDPEKAPSGGESGAGAPATEEEQ